MKRIAFIFFSCLIALNSCTKNDTIPGCLQSKIDEFKNYSCEHGANIREYKFQGRIVYVFNMGFCGADLSAGVIDENCALVGSLGGITGNTQIGGVEFSTAVYVRTIWERL